MTTSEKRFFIKTSTHDSNVSVVFSTVDDIINFYSNKQSLQSKVDDLNNLKGHKDKERNGISTK
ncbi:hypothetical protein EYB31_26580 [Paenibacillus thalictri]|uniref:Uncharacterized protein n=1 Tax=Paenibacillus thalictri TaxID=2527873 RepID=A0A4Q9DJN7_9BACL|nr:hypothetical protein EYB31_26580 [Paenibacillus thalictri]